MSSVRDTRGVGLAMLAINRFLLITFFLSVINSCAFMPDNDHASEETINPTKISTIKTVALLKVATPSKYWMGKPSSGLAGFVNPLISLAATEHETSNIFDRLQYPDNQTQSLQSALNSNGYEVTVVDYPREFPSKLIDDYSNLKDIKADAILDVGPLHIGYMTDLNEPFSDSLSPSIYLHYRLISSTDLEPIFESNAYYSTSKLTDHYSFDGWHQTIIKGPDEHIYSSIEELENDVDEAIKRMQQGINDISKHIASRIKEAGGSIR